MKHERAWILWTDGAVTGSFVEPAKGVVSKAETIILLDHKAGKITVVKDKGGAFKKKGPQSHRLFA